MSIGILIALVVVAYCLWPRKKGMGQAVRCSTCQRIVQSGTEPSDWVTECGCCKNWRT